jgi:hypothetical protein
MSNKINKRTSNMNNTPWLEQVEQYKKFMSKEDVEMCEEYGKHTFEIDYDTGQYAGDGLVGFERYIAAALQSGLHPDDLDDDEFQTMVDLHGDLWFEKYGYDESDVEPRVMNKRKR